MKRAVTQKKYLSTKHWGHPHSALFGAQWARSWKRRQLLDIFTLRYVGGGKKHGFALEINGCIQLSRYSEAAVCASWLPPNGSFKSDRQLWLSLRQRRRRLLDCGSRGAAIETPLIYHFWELKDWVLGSGWKCETQNAALAPPQQAWKWTRLLTIGMFRCTLVTSCCSWSWCWTCASCQPGAAPGRWPPQMAGTWRWFARWGCSRRPLRKREEIKIIVKKRKKSSRQTLNGKMSGSVTKEFILLNQITELMQNKWFVMLRHSQGGM